MHTMNFRPISEVREHWLPGLSFEESVEVIRREYVREHTDPPGEIEICNEEERHGMLESEPC